MGHPIHAYTLTEYRTRTDRLGNCQLQGLQAVTIFMSGYFGLLYSSGAPSCAPRVCALTMSHGRLPVRVAKEKKTEGLLRAPQIVHTRALYSVLAKDSEWSKEAMTDCESCACVSVMVDIYIRRWGFVCSPKHHMKRSPGIRKAELFSLTICASF